VKILLMGNPNVGKSAVFSRLTGTHVIASNYPGTTVGFTRGYLSYRGERVEVIDVPGTYTLDATSKAEEVAVEMLKEGDLVINVVDATNLERNLNLTLQLLERQVPVIVALNMWDDTRHRGINIDVAKLEELLGVPVVPTVGVTGQGIKDLVNHITEAKLPLPAEMSAG
jgi:ferrous iron transport protein B